MTIPRVDVRSELSVEDVMKKKLISTPGDTPITAVAKLMTNHKLSAVLVGPDAIISRGDIITRVIAFAQDPGVVSAKDVCSRPLITCPKDTPLEDAMELMAKNRIERLVVVDGNPPCPIGILTANDILKVSPSLLAIKREVWLLWEAREEEPEIFSGHCDDCKVYGQLRIVGGYALCESCLEEPKPESDEKYI